MVESSKLMGNMKTSTLEEKIKPSSSPTIPSLVKPNTPLGQLNLDWSEKDLPEKLRTKHVHRLHPYLGKFIPQLVEVFLRKFFSKGQTVIDPFCGSGTALVQANELGINSIGYDVSAFNVLLSKVKTQIYDFEQVTTEINQILDEMYLYKDGTLFEHSKTDDHEALRDNKYLKEWFAPKALNDLLLFLKLIPKYKNKNLLKIILSRSARSARMTAHHELDFPKKPQTEEYYCRKHSRMCRPTDNAFKFISRYCMDTVKRIKEFSEVQNGATVKVLNSDSRFAKVPLFHGVVTSPPYVGLIDESSPFLVEISGMTVTLPLQLYRYSGYVS